MIHKHIAPLLIQVAGLIVFFLCMSVSSFAQEQQPENYFVTISINEVEQFGVFPALFDNGEFFIELESFEKLGLVVPTEPVVFYRGRHYLPLSGVPSLELNFERGPQHLDLKCQTSCFPSNRLIRDWQYPQPDPTPLGMFLNYDLLIEKNKNSEIFGALGELGVFSSFGSGVFSFSARDYNDESDFVRLDTHWTIDWPEKQQRLRLGDSISQHGGWGRAVRFGGVQFGTDFGLQPGFISFPTPSITGGATLPSTAEIFVNGVRRASLDIDPGAFTIEHPPLITGSGNLQVVIRDLLGRETIINKPFYASRNLLRESLVEYSIELGFLRNEYGLSSNEYDEMFVSGSYRKGLGSKFTAGLHVEISEKRAGIGPYWDWQTPIGGILSGAAAVSVQGDKTGGLLKLGFNWSSENVGLTVSNEWISKGFTRLGTDINQPEPRMQTSANVGFDVSKNSSLSVSFTSIDEWDEPDLQIAGAHYSRQIGETGSLSVNVSRTFGEFSETSIFMVFTKRLADRTTGNASIARSGGKWRGTIQASQNAPSDGGLGLRAEATVNSGARKRAGATYDTKKGIASLDISQVSGDNTARVGLSGGVTLIGGNVFFSNPINDSFALVKVGEFEGVGVLRDNRPMTKTNSSGYALVPRLRPYEKNPISINPLDLPLTAQIGTATLEPVPRRRSGVIVEFPVVQTVAAMFRVIDSLGNFLPAGTILRSVDNSDEFPVGYNGQVYMTGRERAMTFHAQTPEGKCSLSVAAQEPSRYPKRLGTLTCIGENP